MNDVELKLSGETFAELKGQLDAAACMAVYINEIPDTYEIENVEDLFSELMALIPKKKLTKKLQNAAKDFEQELDAIIHYLADGNQPSTGHYVSMSGGADIPPRETLSKLEWAALGVVK